MVIVDTRQLNIILDVKELIYYFFVSCNFPSNSLKRYITTYIRMNANETTILKSS